jgi:hypothetical protein
LMHTAQRRDSRNGMQVNNENALSTVLYLQQYESML